MKMRLQLILNSSQSRQQDTKYSIKHPKSGANPTPLCYSNDDRFFIRPSRQQHVGVLAYSYVGSTVTTLLHASNAHRLSVANAFQGDKLPQIHSGHSRHIFLLPISPRYRYTTTHCYRCSLQIHSVCAAKPIGHEHEKMPNVLLFLYAGAKGGWSVLVLLVCNNNVVWWLRQTQCWHRCVYMFGHLREMFVV